MSRNFTDIIFVENQGVDADQLNAIYYQIGWDNRRCRTRAQTIEMLNRSYYYIGAHTTGNMLVGFSRICGDPYVVQVLDVITHPAYRGRGIATRCMEGVRDHIMQAKYVSVTLTADKALGKFYERFGFHTERADSLRWDNKLRQVAEI